ncbi:MAG TPA: hypothetical protein VGN49_02805 [Micrococcaceae bacterium]|jgi:hypothetical protein|nr:hypothetical protein [Micrococcaceae bacterium]
MDELIEKVAVAAADKESAQFQLDNTAADLRDMVLAALASGVTAEELAGASGLTPQEIRRIRVDGPAGPDRGV